jgi:hypothetical protein
MAASGKRQWIEGKGKGKRLFAPELGGSYEVFNVRPLAEEIAIYCTQDAKFMPKLWKQYFTKLSPSWARKVDVATEGRIFCLRPRDMMEKGRTGLWGHGNSVVRTSKYVLGWEGIRNGKLSIIGSNNCLVTNRAFPI